MKRPILFLLFCLLGCASFAQKIQFSNPTNVWALIDSTVGCCVPMATQYTTAYYDSPLVYNGNTYQLMTDPEVGTCLIREDSNRVYVIGGPLDSIERVLYDFNLVIGDTMRYVYSDDTIIAWVAGMDSTRIAGIWYKVWQFQGLDYSAIFHDSVRGTFYNVIEGIGCTNGPYYPARPFSLQAFSEQVLCFTNNTVISSPLSNPVLSYGFHYTGSFDNYLSCIEFDTLTHSAGVPFNGFKGNENSVTVIPDPINELGKLVFSYPIYSGKVIIINQTGQIITSFPFENKDELMIGDKINVPGVYFYRVTDNLTGQVFSGKFIFQ